MKKSPSSVPCPRMEIQWPPLKFSKFAQNLSDGDPRVILLPPPFAHLPRVAPPCPRRKHLRSSHSPETPAASTVSPSRSPFPVCSGCLCLPAVHAKGDEGLAGSAGIDRPGGFNNKRCSQESCPEQTAAATFRPQVRQPRCITVQLWYKSQAFLVFHVLAPF